MVAAGVQFQSTVHDAAWHPGGPVHRQSILSKLRDACKLDTLMSQATLGHRNSLARRRTRWTVFPRSRPGSRTPPLEREGRALSAPPRRRGACPAWQLRSPRRCVDPPWRRFAPEAWDFAVTSCLRPASWNTGAVTASTEHETLLRMFQDTTNRCHHSSGA